MRGGRLRFQLAIGIVAALLACEAPRRGTPIPVGQVSGSAGEVSAPTPAGDGVSVTITVKWPERHSQATLPTQMERVLVRVYRAGTGEQLPANLDLRRTQFPVATTGTLDNLPAGNFVFSVRIEDGNGTKIAGGSVSRTLVPNERARLAIPVYPSPDPRLLEVSPLVVGPGGHVNILGENLGLSAGFPLRVFLGDVEVPADHLTRLSDFEVRVRVPEGSPGGKVSLRVGRKSLSDDRVIRLIDRIRLRVIDSVPLSPGGAFDLAWEVTTRDGTVLENTNLDWACDGCDLPADVIPRGDFAIVKAPEKPGTLKVSLSAGSVRGEVVLSTTAFSRSTLPADLGRLDLALASRSTVVPAQADLGESLFHDPALSRGGVMSCATCHQDSLNHADGRRLPLDRDGKALKRNTPSLLNTGLAQAWFWDGRATSLEAQAHDVFLNPREFDQATSSVEALLQETPRYIEAFGQAFAASPSYDLALKAIAAYERTLVTPFERSPYGRWITGDDTALTASQRRGLALFVGRARCILCHAGPTWSDDKFHNIVVPGSGTLDPGRISVTGRDADWGAFKSSPLWSISRSAPYFHDGSQATLAGAILHYTKFDPGIRNQSPQLRQVPLLPDDLTDLERFLEALTPAEP